MRRSTRATPLTVRVAGVAATAQPHQARASERAVGRAFDELPGVRMGMVGAQVAREHAGELGDAGLVHEDRRAGARPAPLLRLDHRDVGIRECSHLGKVRHAEHLMSTSQPGQRSSHRRSRFPTDPGVDLVEDERRRCLRQHDSERKHRARKLAAGRGPGERPGCLTGVRREQERDVVDPVVS